GTRRQHVAAQRGTRTAREFFSIPQITREQFHLFEVLSRHVLFLSFLHSGSKIDAFNACTPSLNRNRRHNQVSTELPVLAGEVHLYPCTWRHRLLTVSDSAIPADYIEADPQYVRC